MSVANKENTRNYHLSEDKKSTGKSRSSYFDMAGEINKEMTMASDQKIALKTQCKDVSDMVDKICQDYDRDDADAKMAQFIHNSDSKQQARQKNAELKKGEDMALMVAIDERLTILISFLLILECICSGSNISPEAMPRKNKSGWTKKSPAKQF